MTAYEFTRANAPIDMGAKIKARGFGQDMLEKFKAQIETNHSDIRQSAEYTESHDLFIELTMSCDKDEAIMWMKAWEYDAIAYGLSTKNLDWQHKFLAAYDICNSLTKENVK